MSTTSNNNLRVVSYNVLSSKLARASHFTQTLPEYLDVDYRLPRILNKLEAEIDRSSAATSLDANQPPPAIFCLQEIDYTITSSLHTFFANKGYAFVTGLYGKKFNGYMGIGIAYPLKDFETIKVDVCRLSDEGDWPRLERSEEREGVIGRVRKSIKKFTSKTVRSLSEYIGKHLGTQLLLGSSSKESTIDPWEMSENRFNVLLTVALRFRSAANGADGGVFSISNYHMPCAFYCPPVMNIHIDLAVKRVQYLASKTWRELNGVIEEKKEWEDGGATEQTDSEKAIPREAWKDANEDTSTIAGQVSIAALENKTVPHILAGDFNILPDSPHYTLITSGKLQESDPSYPPMKYGTKWMPSRQTMDSAYALYGKEPEFTNYAHLKEEEDAFIGTLDYIFLSQKEGDASSGWTVKDTIQLPGREDSGGPFPNENEPSDHLLIGADLELAS
jgi:mRNA deadenylase 3'-5' endonuclease subunit Ccr4